MTCIMCITLCNHHKRGAKQSSITPKVSVMLFFYSHILPCSSFLATTDLFCIICLLENGIMQYVIFRDWPFSFSIVALRVIQDNVGINSLFLFIS